MSKSRYLVLTGLILSAAIARLLPHPWNFTPVAAMALFGGAQFTKRSLAFLVPLGALLLSDIFIGFYSTMWVVYAAFAFIVVIGLSIRNRRRPSTVFAASIASSSAFFLITNAAHWWMSGMYARSVAGLMTCFSAGIPFYRNAIVGDLLFSAVLFGGLALIETAAPAVREPAYPAAMPAAHSS